MRFVFLGLSIASAWGDGHATTYRGLSWGTSFTPGAYDFFDYVMCALAPFDVTVTLCSTPPSRGLRPDHSSPPVDPGELAYFCQQIVRRYQ